MAPCLRYSNKAKDPANLRIEIPCLSSNLADGEAGGGGAAAAADDATDFRSTRTTRAPVQAHCASLTLTDSETPHNSLSRPAESVAGWPSQSRRPGREAGISNAASKPGRRGHSYRPSLRCGIARHRRSRRSPSRPYKEPAGNRIVHRTPCAIAERRWWSGPTALPTASTRHTAAVIRLRDVLDEGLSAPATRRELDVAPSRRACYKRRPSPAQRFPYAHPADTWSSIGTSLT